MWKIAAAVLLSVVACSDSTGVQPLSQADPGLNLTTQGKGGPSLEIELVSGDCASGITVRVRGTGLPGKARLGDTWLDLTNLTSIGPKQVDLGKGGKKLVEWTTSWSSAEINPVSGGKFNGEARAVITDAYGAVIIEGTPTFIGPNCSAI